MGEEVEVPYSWDKEEEDVPRIDTYATANDEEDDYYQDEYEPELSVSSIPQNKPRFFRSKWFILVCIPVIVVAIVVAVKRTQGGGGNTGAQTTGASSGKNATMLCNGLANLCTQPLDKVMFATVHNAMSSRADNFLGWNNVQEFEGALDLGFRGLFIDSCDCSIGVQLCHASCSYGYRRPKPAFSSIVDFLDRNRNEVILIEIQVNGDSLMELFQVISEIDGFQELLYQHPGRMAPWPTLQELIEQNTRLVIFQHDNGDCNIEGSCPYGVLNFFEYAYETTFGARGTEELLDYDASCQVTRGSPENPFGTLNHFAANRLGLPDYDIAQEVNQREVAEERLEACHQRLGQKINLFVVDFWSTAGGVVDLVQEYNQALGFVTESPSEVPSRTPTALPIPPTVPSPAPSFWFENNPTTEAPSVGEDIFAPSTTTISPTTSRTPSNSPAPTSSSTGSNGTLAPTGSNESSTLAPSPFVGDNSTLAPTSGPIEISTPAPSLVVGGNGTLAPTSGPSENITPAPSPVVGDTGTAAPTSVPVADSNTPVPSLTTPVPTIPSSSSNTLAPSVVPVAAPVEATPVPTLAPSVVPVQAPVEAPTPVPTETTPPPPPCGDGVIGNGDCTDSSLCCSEYGWCGTGPAYCGP